MVMKKVGRLTRKDKEIFRTLYLANRPIPIKKISARTNISWKTVDESVKRLNRLQVVELKKSIRRTNVALNQDMLKTIMKLRRNRGIR